MRNAHVRILGALYGGKCVRCTNAVDILSRIAGTTTLKSRLQIAIVAQACLAFIVPFTAHLHFAVVQFGHTAALHNAAAIVE